MCSSNVGAADVAASQHARPWRKQSDIGNLNNIWRIRVERCLETEGLKADEFGDRGTERWGHAILVVAAIVGGTDIL